MRGSVASESVGSLRRAGSGARIEEVIDAFAAEATLHYSAVRVPRGRRRMLTLVRGGGGAHLVGM